MTIEEAKRVSEALKIIAEQFGNKKYYTGNVLVGETTTDAAQTIDWLIDQIESEDEEWVAI